MSREDYEVFKQLKQERQLEGATRREKAEIDFPAVKAAGMTCGVRVNRYSESHYQFRSDGWLLDVWPGNLRVKWGELQKVYPRIDLPEEWGLADVLRALVPGVAVETFYELRAQRDAMFEVLAALKAKLDEESDWWYGREAERHWQANELLRLFESKLTEEMTSQINAAIAKHGGG